MTPPALMVSITFSHRILLRHKETSVTLQKSNDPGSRIKHCFGGLTHQFKLRHSMPDVPPLSLLPKSSLIKLG